MLRQTEIQAYLGVLVAGKSCNLPLWLLEPSKYATGILQRFHQKVDKLVLANLHGWKSQQVTNSNSSCSFPSFAKRAAELLAQLALFQVEVRVLLEPFPFFTYLLVLGQGV